MPGAAADPHAGMDMGSMTADAASHTVAGDAGIEAVAKADGGYTVAEIHAQAEALSGKPVRVRGQVVKFTANIMGTNWIHLQDGTGEGSHERPDRHLQRPSRRRRRHRRGGTLCP